MLVKEKSEKIFEKNKVGLRGLGWVGCGGGECEERSKIEISAKTRKVEGGEMINVGVN